MVGFPNNHMGVPTKNDHFGVFWGYRHLRKHPYITYKSQPTKGRDPDQTELVDPSQEGNDRLSSNQPFSEKMLDLRGD